MKKILFSVCSFVYCCLVTSVSFAQTSIISPTSVTVGQLNTEQTIRYNKVIADSNHINYQLVHIEPLASSQQNGKVAVSFTNAPCTNTFFEAERVEYFSNDSNYFWYGNLSYQDSASDCYKGFAMLLAREGEHFGQIQILNRTYDIIDLTGGIQLIAESDSFELVPKTCGTSNLKTTAPTYNTTDEEMNFCNVRVLVLYTPLARVKDVNILNRIDLAMAQTKMALLNSAIYPGSLNLSLAAAEEIHYSEAEYTTGGGGLGWDIIQMTDSGDVYNIATEVRLARARHKADIVVMFVKGANKDDLIGSVYRIQDSIYPYAVVAKEWATNSAFIFAHEVAHIFGARHEDAGLNADVNYSKAHAHNFSYTSTAGIWPFKKTYINWQRTIPYAKTGNNGEAVLHFSNPDINFKGTPTGTVSSPHGARNAAQYLKNMGCVVSNYWPLESGDFYVSNAGLALLCPGSSSTYYGKVRGIPGSYFYEWSMSTDGINYGSILATTKDYTFTMPSSAFRVHLKFKVTDPTGKILNSVFVINRKPSIICPSLKRLEDEANNKSQYLTIKPNPTFSQYNLSYYLPKSGNINVELYDVLGKQIKSVFSGYINEGYHDISADMTGLSSGIYYIKISSELLNETQKIVKY